MLFFWPGHAAIQKVDRGASKRLVAAGLALLAVLTGGCQRHTLRPIAPDPETSLAANEGTFSRAELLDSSTCGGCHSETYGEWQQSAHAAAADDPVFLAMNRMAQRETNGAIGQFCVQCHAPLAVREGATTDGLNLASVPKALKGVTCFYCHSVDRVEGTHNNALHVANDNVMRGPIRDAVKTAGHKSAYSPLHDRNTPESSAMCGSCHDVVTPPGAELENTYKEWQASVYAHAVTGLSCGSCHMPQTSQTAISDDPNAPLRHRHAHGFPGLDLPLPHVPTDGPPAVVQDRAVAKQNLKALLDKTLQTALCVKQVGDRASLRVVLDNVGAGHAFTSGAVQDRRLWMEVKAYKKGKLIYQSGVVPQNSPVLSHMDEDLWLIRSCMFDKTGAPTKHFWQAAKIDSNALPTINTLNVADPNFYRSNVVRAYPKDRRATLPEVPDKVTLRILVEPIGLDLLDELVATKDLDARVRAAAETLVVGPDEMLIWTSDTAHTGYQEHGMPVRCASTSRINLTGKLFDAPEHQRCD